MNRYANNEVIQPTVVDTPPDKPPLKPKPSIGEVKVGHVHPQSYENVIKGEKYINVEVPEDYELPPSKKQPPIDKIQDKSKSLPPLPVFTPVLTPPTTNRQNSTGAIEGPNFVSPTTPGGPRFPEQSRLVGGSSEGPRLVGANSEGARFVGGPTFMGASSGGSVDTSAQMRVKKSSIPTADKLNNSSIGKPKENIRVSTFEEDGKKKFVTKIVCAAPSSDVSAQSSPGVSHGGVKSNEYSYAQPGATVGARNTNNPYSYISGATGGSTKSNEYSYASVEPGKEGPTFSNSRNSLGRSNNGGPTFVSTQNSFTSSDSTKSSQGSDRLSQVPVKPAQSDIYSEVNPVTRKPVMTAISRNHAYEEVQFTQGV